MISLVFMNEKLYMNAPEVEEAMGISVAFAYKIIRNRKRESHFCPVQPRKGGTGLILG